MSEPVIPDALVKEALGAFYGYGLPDAVERFMGTKGNGDYLIRKALAAVVAWRDENGEPWDPWGARWSCPDCAFTFDAAHVDDATGTYSCPVCSEARLEARVAALEAALEAVVAAPNFWSLGQRVVDAVEAALAGQDTPQDREGGSTPVQVQGPRPGRKPDSDERRTGHGSAASLAAPEVVMDARGIYWRRWPEGLDPDVGLTEPMWSMMPMSDDNLPTQYPLVVYRPVATETEAGQDTPEPEWYECGRCGGRMFWQDCPTGGWWIHEHHPDDDHDAAPILAGQDTPEPPEAMDPEHWPPPHPFPAPPPPVPARCPTCDSNDPDVTQGPECLFDGEFDRWHDLWHTEGER